MLTARLVKVFLPATDYRLPLTHERRHMKRVLFLLAVVVGLAPLIVSKTNPPPRGGEPQAAATPLKMPTTLTLGTEAKLGAVAFNHEAHAATGKRNIAGTGPIACVECHHAAQPA